MNVRVFALCALVALFCHSQAKAQEVLTNSSIIELVKEQFDEALIISQIESNKNTFKVGVAEMRELKAAGVSTTIIAKMAAAEKDPKLAYTDPNDILAPHTPGIYYKTGGMLVEFLPTNAPNTQTRAAGAVFGSAFIPVKIVAQMTGERSPNVFDPPPTLYFYFNQQTTGSAFDAARLSYYAFQSATSPREFVLAELNVRKGKRELEVGSGNVHNSKTGLSAKQTRQLDAIQQLAPGIFKVELPPLDAGEYCIVHSAMGGWASQHQKIYDFHTNGFRSVGFEQEAPSAKPPEPAQEQLMSKPPPLPEKSAPALDVVKPAPVPHAPIEPEVQRPQLVQPVQQDSTLTPKAGGVKAEVEPSPGINSEMPTTRTENVKSSNRTLVEGHIAPSAETLTKGQQATRQAVDGELSTEQKSVTTESAPSSVAYPLNVPDPQSEPQRSRVPVPVSPSPISEAPMSLDQKASRTRLHLGLDWGIPTDLLPDIMSNALGGAVSLEFSSFSRVRPVLDLSFMRAAGKFGTKRLESRTPARDFFTGSIGLRCFTGPEQRGFHLDMLVGANLMRTSHLADEVSFSPAFGLGALLFGRLDFSCRYQLFLDRQYWAQDRSQGDVNLFKTGMNHTGYISNGLVVFRTALVLGGGLRPQRTAVPSPTRAGQYRTNQVRTPHHVRSANTGSCRQQVALLQMQVDSLSNQVNEQKGHMSQLEQETQDLNGQVAKAQAALALAQKEVEAHSQMSRTSNRTKEGQTADGSFDRCVVVNEQLAPFGANAEQVYTMLHTFSDPFTLDTFRVITLRMPDGSAMYQLQIVGGDGRLLRKEEILGAGAPAGGKASTALQNELDALRARTLLGPAAFRKPPQTINLTLQFNRQSTNGLYFEVDKETWDAIANDTTAIGFVLGTGEAEPRVLVYCKAQQRVVDIAPVQP